MTKPYYSMPLISLDPVVVDTETTGLDVTRARIVQIGAVHIRQGHISADSHYDVLIYPEEPIPAATTAIHGITDQLVADANRFSEIAGDFTKFLSDAAIVGHNIGFDIAMLKREFTLSGGDWSAPPILDTMVLSRIVNPVLPNFSLEVIANWLGVHVKNRHSALGDATTTAQIYLALLPLLRKTGIRTIADAQRASTSLSQQPSEQSDYAAINSSIGAPDNTETLTAIRRVDSFPFQYRVRDVMSSPALIVEAGMAPAQLAKTLSDQKKSAAFVALPDPDAGFGIVTERDLMRLLAREDVKTVGDVANAPLQTVGDDEFIYKALGRMHQLSVRHLGVRDASGALIGALTSGDLLRQRADDAIEMSGDWDRSLSVEALAANWGRLPLIAQSLLDEGIDAPHITAVLGEQLATVTRRAAELAEAQMIENGKGGPPAPYAVLLLGSGSRGETLLAPDQDNAIVYANGHDGADEWFAEFGKIASDILDEAGVPHCKGGVMASNAEWRQSLQSWKNTIHDWLSRAEWKDLCYVDIFYDFQVVHGDRKLAHELWTYAYDLAGKAPGFVQQLSALATSFGPPLGFFGGLKSVNGRVDLKGGGTLPIVAGARVLALRHGIRERSTRRRIEGIKNLDVVNFDDLDDILSAHDFLVRQILEQQLEDMADGIAPSSRVDLRRLSKRARTSLKQALKKVAVMHTAVGEPLGFG